MDDVLIVLGGIIPNQDVDSLKRAGVAGYFPARHRDGRTSSNSFAPTSSRAACQRRLILMAEISTSRLRELLQPP